jgi:hypothetical protein
MERRRAEKRTKNLTISTKVRSGKKTTLFEPHSSLEMVFVFFSGGQQHNPNFEVRRRRLVV